MFVVDSKNRSQIVGTRVDPCGDHCLATVVLVLWLLLPLGNCQQGALVSCTGSCASLATNFDPLTAKFCQSQQVKVACPATGVIYGGNVYSRYSDIPRAAVHAGFCTSGQTVNLYIFWAGYRQNFYSATANGITSTATSAEWGVLLTDQAVCPKWLTPTSNRIVGLQAATGGAVVGSTYYAVGSVLDTAVIHAGIATAGSTLTCYTYEIGRRKIFYQSTAFGISSVCATNKSGIALTLNDTQPKVSPTATFVTVYLPLAVPAGQTVFGAGIYPFNQPVEGVVLHSGFGWLGQNVSLWFHYIRDETLFYSATQFVISSTASNGVLLPGFAVSKNPSFQDVESTVTPITLSFEPSAHACTGFGGRYSFTSDLAALAILEDLIKEGERKTIYVHNIATQSVFYGGEKYWFICVPYLGPGTLIMVTATPQRPTPAQRQQVKLTLSGLAKSWEKQIWGTRVYTYTSDLEKVAYHMGLLNVNEEKSFYLYPVTGWDIFYSSTRRGVTSGSSAAAQAAFTLSTSPVPPTDLTNPDSFQVELDGFSLTGGGLFGCGYYLWNSDLALAGMQMGLVGFEQTVTLWVHRIAGNNPNPWFYCNSNGVASSFSKTVDVGFLLSTSSNRSGVVNATPFAVTIRAVVYPTGSSAIGTTVYHPSSDITAAAFHMNLIAYGETKTLYLWQLGKSPFFYRSCPRGFCSTSAPGGTSSWTLSSSVSPPAQVELGGLIHRVTLNVVPGVFSISGPPVGYLPFSSAMGLLDAAAFMTDLARPGQTVTVFVHDVGSVNGFSSAVVHGFQSATSPSVGQGFTILNTSSPPTYNDDARPLYLCFQNDWNSWTGKDNLVYGTVYYRGDSNLLLAAYHAGLLQSGQCANLWLHYIGIYTNYYSSTFKDFTSNSAFTSGRAFRFSNSSTNPGPPSMPLQVTLQLSRMIIGNPLAGCGTYSRSSDLTMAAYHTDLLDIDGPAVTLYLHEVSTRSVWFRCTSRSLTSVTSSDSGTGFVLSTSVAPPSWISNPKVSVMPLTWNTEKDVATATKPQFSGSTWYTYDSDLLFAAVAEGLILPTQKVTLFIHTLPVSQTNFYSSYRNGVMSSSLFTTVTSLMLSNSSTPPSIPSSFFINLQVEETTSIGSVWGCKYYRRESELTTAAIHAGLVGPGSGPTTVYVHSTGTVQSCWSCYQNGITSTFYDDILCCVLEPKQRRSSDSIIDEAECDPECI